jgi:hypothetical protein
VCVWGGGGGGGGQHLVVTQEWKALSGELQKLGQCYLKIAAVFTFGCLKPVLTPFNAHVFVLLMATFISGVICNE